MRRLPEMLGCLALLVALCVVPPQKAATAAAPCPDISATLDPNGLVTAEEWVECPDAAAVGPTSVVPVSFGGSAPVPAAAMTTGKLADAAAPNDGPGTTTEHHTVARGGWDVSVLALDIVVPEAANCLAFDFVFASEELAEFRGSEFNDGFVAELDGSSWSVTAGGSIKAPDNFATDANGALISINSAAYQEDVETGTEYDGATDLLAAQSPVTPGEHSVYLSIFDAGDAKYDSAVWIANLRTEQRSDGPCAPGVNALPTAEIAVEPTQGEAPLEVSFSGVDSADDGEIVAYDWDFGDARRAAGVAVTHTYTTRGTYQAMLTVTDDAGATDSATVEITVEGGNSPPVAEFSIEPDFGDPPLTVVFDASGSNDPDGSVIAYVWDFGDGTTGTGVTAGHDYTLAGSYEVRLAVIDDAGAVGYQTRTLLVGSGPPVADHVMVNVYDAVHWETLWSVDADIDAGNVVVTATGGSLLSVTGTAGVPSPAGGSDTATVTFEVRRLTPFPFYFGWVRVADPAVGVSLGAPFVVMAAVPEAGAAVGTNFGLRLKPHSDGPPVEVIKLSWRVIDAA